MQEKGYIHYEVSNFARLNMESRHNLVYWHNEFYYGFGAGAHGYLHGMRTENHKSISAYIRSVQLGLPWIKQKTVSCNESMEDFMMLGLRLLDGVCADTFKQKYNADMNEVFAKPLQKLIHRDLLESTHKGYRLTKQGLLFGNDVFISFL